MCVGMNEWVAVDVLGSFYMTQCNDRGFLRYGVLDVDVSIIATRSVSRVEGQLNVCNKTAL